VTLLLLACTATPSATDSGAACPCDALPTAPTVTDEAGLLSLLRSTRDATFPGDYALAVQAETDLAYFRASIDPESFSSDRVYVISYDPVVLADPPDTASLAAILVHELGHVDDYLAMDNAEYVEFGLWYGAQDGMTSDELRDYERATDEKALERGCAEGLAAMREWIYAHASAEVRAEKERNYYAPEEIEAWVAANGECRG
jgi:hypothetical protein